MGIPREPSCLEESRLMVSIEPGRTLCVEVYCEREDGSQGIKLENYFLLINDGVEVLTQGPFGQSLIFS